MNNESLYLQAKDRVEEAVIAFEKLFKGSGSYREGVIGETMGLLYDAAYNMNHGVKDELKEVANAG